MSNPLPVACAKGSYTKVATNISSGFLWRVKADASLAYYYTYKLTGQAAPTLLSDAVRIFRDDMGSYNVLELTFKELVDVYIWCTGEAGEVRADV